MSALGAVTVAASGGELHGHALGGRRARLALAVAGGPVPSQQLATMIWGENLPPSWKPALLGIVRGIRMSIAEIGGLGEQLVVTTPAGCTLAPHMAVDVREAATALDDALQRLAESRPDAAAAPRPLLTKMPLSDGQCAE
ncbi:MAG: hypothetical protein M3O28_14275 [Actinomycetota bacterium]|nr:hypothetical protein [Actinomycetota bacterium]